MIKFNICLFIILIILYYFLIKKYKERIDIDNHIKEINNTIKQENQELEKEKKALNKEVTQLNQQSIQSKKDLLELQETVKATSQNQIELSQKAFENYCEVLSNKYEKEEEDYDEFINTLKESYSKLQLELMREADKCRTELDELKKTRAAAIQANLREKEIKDKLSFYCLQISEGDLADVRMLEKIKPNLNKPRVLSMLIWSTFFQKQMNTLCVNVLGTKIVTGIYKITNQSTGEVYIGQAVDVASRWKQHAKCGLGIDTPAANKLYKAMQEDGIWNFSWELLEECKAIDLNKKEREYIELYQSKDYGYNNNKGVRD